MCVTKRSSRDQKIVENLNKELYELQKCGELCDYELTTEDGGSFKVHKWVLYTVSPFFTKLLDKNTKFSERNSDTILMRRVSSSVLENIIKYMYTGEMEISFDTAKEIIDTALFLNLRTLVEYGIETLVESLDEGNCLDLLRYSDTCLHYGDVLTKKSLKLVSHKIKDFMNLPDFLKLSSDIMKILVVNEKTTETLYLAVKNWLTFDLSNREQFVGTLMKEVKFEKLSLEFAKTNIFDDNPLLKMQSFQERIYGSMINNWKKLKSNYDNLYLILGNEMLLYDENHFSDNVITRIESEREFIGYTTFDKKNIFVCGGVINDRFVNTCSYFCTERNEWKDLPSMKYARKGSSPITLGNEIYVCGGSSRPYSNDFIKTVEVFDIHKSTWSNIKDLKNFSGCNYRSSLCDLNNYLYFINGRSIQRLDTRHSGWEIVSNAKCCSPIVSAKAYNNFIYGFTYDSKEILTFDIRIKKWLETTQPNCTKSTWNFPLTCIVDDRLCVLNCLEENDFEGYELQTRNLSNLQLHDSAYGVLKNSKWCQAFFSF